MQYVVRSKIGTGCLKLPESVKASENITNLTSNRPLSTHSSLAVAEADWQESKIPPSGCYIA